MKYSRIVVGSAALLAAMCAAAAGRITIVSEDQAAKSWTPAPDSPRVLAGYPGAAADKSQDVCVNIGFLIDKDGKTSNFTQMKVWSSAQPDRDPDQAAVQPFVQSAAAAVSLWRFVPVGGKPRSIFTSAAIAFAGSQALAAEDIRGRCKIADLADFVAQGQAKESRRGGLARDQQRERERQPRADSQRY